MYLLFVVFGGAWNSLTTVTDNAVETQSVCAWYIERKRLVPKGEQQITIICLDTANRVRTRTFARYYTSCVIGNVLFNDALNTFYLLLYGVGHMVKDI